MQSIERYGVIALVFLAVTVVAVIMWDDGDSASDTVSAAEPGSRTTEANSPRPGRVPLRSNPSRSLPLQRGGQQREIETLSSPETTPAATPPVNYGGILPPSADDVARPVDPPSTLLGEAGLASERSNDRGTDRTPPAPVGNTQRLYEVKSNETLSEISERELGTWKKWKEIVELNPGLDPNRLRVGVRLVLPPRGAADTAPAAPAASTPAAEPGPDAKGRTWTVGEGDNLWKIAAEVLGDGARWGEIAKANPGMNVDRLKLGQKINLPAGTTSTTRPARESAVADATPTKKSTRGGKVR